METQDILDGMRGWIETVGLVPPDYEQYAPLVIDGLLHFLSRLPATRLEAIVAAQLELPESAEADERLIGLLRQCPTLHKLGQVIARQAGLPLDLRARLQGLESLAPAPGSYDIDAIVAAEIGVIEGLTVAPDALAEGSVAFVVPFELRSAADGSIRRGVFKALKPEASARLLEDLAIWPELGEYLTARSAEVGLAAVDFRSLLEGVANLLRNEIQLDGEQERLRRARRFYADEPSVIVPELFAFCTPRLTAMERVDGVKVTDPSLPVDLRRRLARTIVAALLAKPFWSTPAGEPFFHADPHAGNLFATPDGKLAIFDWALTTHLNSDQCSAVVQTLVCAAVLDEPGVAAQLAALGDIKAPATVAAGIAAAVAGVRRGAFPGFAWLTALLDRLGRDGAIVFPEETALFRKSLLTLSGVVRDVWPYASVDEVLLASGGRRFVAESWSRPLAPFGSRAFATHVSNSDLVRLMTSLTWTPTRYLLGTYRDALEVLTR